MIFFVLFTRLIVSNSVSKSYYLNQSRFIMSNSRKYLSQVTLYLFCDVLILFVTLNQTISQAFSGIWETLGIQDDDISYGAGIKWARLGFGVNSSLN